MMGCTAALRALWVFGPSTTSTSTTSTDRHDLLLSRRWATVERRAVKLQESDGEPYVPIPDDAEFVRLFQSQRAAALSKQETQHVNVVSTDRGHLGPLVTWDQGELRLVALPLPDLHFTQLLRSTVPLEPEQRLHTGIYFTSLSISPIQLIHLPCVTVTLQVLEDVANFITQYSNRDVGMLAKLQTYIATALPFGRPLEMNPACLGMIRKQGFPPSDTSLSVKRPAWKPYLYKGKQQRLEFTIHEEIKAAQYDKKDIADTWQVTGSITCKAELEDVPEITVCLTQNMPQSATTLTSAPASSSTRNTGGLPTLSHFTVSPKVQASDVLATKKLCFSPPLSPFTLCSYAATGLARLPIRGFYQMKEIENNQVKLLVQLKLEADVNNHFEYCEVHIPFPNRGKIVATQVSPTAGTISFDTHEQTLIWNIGQRFTARNLEVALPATLTFSRKHRKPNLSTEKQHHSERAGQGHQDPFCTGSNSYVRLNFKILDYLLTGLTIEGKTLAIYPNTKLHQLNVQKEVIARDYYIWNSFGACRWAQTIE
ncbi:AP-5 complex subunit mu-1 [Balamuthia mandrillaris]